MRYLSANTLKTIAIITMLIDHTAEAMVGPETALYVIMRFIGRITAPIMFYFIVEGYFYTRDKNKYAIRLGVFALVSYLPFVWFISGGIPDFMSYFRLNVIYTLFIGLSALRVIHEMEESKWKRLALAGLILLSLPGDWSAIAILYIITFDRYRGDFPKQAKAYLIVTLLTGAADFLYPVIVALGGQSVEVKYIVNALINLGRFLPIGLLYFYNGEKGRGGKWSQWGFYIFYPLHLIILCYLANMLK